MGLVDNEGISQHGSGSALKVRLFPLWNLVQVHTQATDHRGIALSYYFLANENKVSGMVTLAMTPVMASGIGHEGDVVGYVPAGTDLLNGNTAQRNICFFGIVESDYWTTDAEDLLGMCVDIVLQDGDLPGDYDGDSIIDDDDNIHEPGR